MVSIDSSTSFTSISVFKNCIFEKFCDINLEKEKCGEARLDNMCRQVFKILSQEQPNIVVIEMTVVVRSASAQRSLTELVGAVRGWCLLNGSTFFFRIRPSEWRKLVKGDDETIPRKRDALKEWSIAKANAYLNAIGSSVRAVNDNESDSLLIGLAYIEMFRPKTINNLYPSIKTMFTSI